MVTPLRWTNIATPTLDTSGVQSATDALLKSSAGIGTGLNNIINTDKANFVVRQENALRDEAQRLGQAQLAGIEQERAGLAGLQTANPNLIEGITGQGNLNFRTLSDQDITSNEDYQQRLAAEFGVQPELINPFDSTADKGRQEFAAQQALADQSILDRETYGANAATFLRDERIANENRRQDLVRQAQGIRDQGGAITGKQQTDAFNQFVANDAKLQNVVPETLEKFRSQILDAETKRRTLSAEGQGKLDLVDKVSTDRHNNRVELEKNRINRALAEIPVSQDVSPLDNITGRAEAVDTMLGEFSEELWWDSLGSAGGQDLAKYVNNMLDQKYESADGKLHDIPASIVKAAISSTGADTGWGKPGKSTKAIEDRVDALMPTYLAEAGRRAERGKLEDELLTNLRVFGEEHMADLAKNQSEAKAGENIFRVGDALKRARPANAPEAKKVFDAENKKIKAEDKAAGVETTDAEIPRFPFNQETGAAVVDQLGLPADIGSVENVAANVSDFPLAGSAVEQAPAAPTRAERQVADAETRAAAPSREERQAASRQARGVAPTNAPVIEDPQNAFESGRNVFNRLGDAVGDTSRRLGETRAAGVPREERVDAFSQAVAQQRANNPNALAGGENFSYADADVAGTLRNFANQTGANIDSLAQRAGVNLAGSPSNPPNTDPGEFLQPSRGGIPDASGINAESLSQFGTPQAAAPSTVAAVATPDAVVEPASDRVPELVEKPGISEEEVVAPEVVKEAVESNGDTISPLLLQREGLVLKSYQDGDKLAGGLGHQLTSAEAKKYPLGTNIPESKAMEWYRADSSKALSAANKQMKAAGIDPALPVNAPNFGDTTAGEIMQSVNFQLGTGWVDKFYETWPAIKKANYNKAINNLKKSDWNDQTEVRVEDLVALLTQLKANKGT